MQDWHTTGSTRLKTQILYVESTLKRDHVANIFYATLCTLNYLHDFDKTMVNYFFHFDNYTVDFRFVLMHTIYAMRYSFFEISWYYIKVSD